MHGSYFSLTAADLSSLQGPKVACVVSKKIAAQAVDRNEIERHCRSALRPLLKDVNTPIALIFHAKREARGAGYAEIARDIEKLLSSLSARGTMRAP